MRGATTDDDDSSRLKSTFCDREAQQGMLLLSSSALPATHRALGGSGEGTHLCVGWCSFHTH